MKNVQIISPRNITSHNKLLPVIGKKVIAYSGELVGKVREVAYDHKNVVGIYVVGRSKHGKLLIGMDYIDQIHADSVVLKINPVSTLVGKIVFDKDGKKVGKVRKIVRSSTANNFKELIVKKTSISKAIHIPRDYMEVIAKNIILNRNM